MVAERVQLGSRLANLDDLADAVLELLGRWVDADRDANESADDKVFEPLFRPVLFQQRARQANVTEVAFLSVLDLLLFLVGAAFGFG